VQDPVIFLIAALTGLGGFTAWLLRDYIAYLKAQTENWRQIAYRGANVAEKAVEKVP
jgi:hypothetical protein